MTKVLQHPRRNQIYTLEEIALHLYLRDSPALGIPEVGCVQDSHLPNGCETLLTVPGFKDSKWRYIRETIEWIPVFAAEDSDENIALIMSCVDVEPYDEESLQYMDDSSVVNWVTPKGFPRSQRD